MVSFQPGNLDVRKLSTALYQKDRIGCATRGGQDRPGIRLSPHFYNTHADIDRTVAAVKKYMASGVLAIGCRCGFTDVSRAQVSAEHFTLKKLDRLKWRPW